MSDEGKSVKAIAKACNMPAAKVRAVVDSDDGNEDATASAAAPAPIIKKLPSGAGLASCDCQGTVPPSSVGRGRFPASEHQRGGPHDRAGAVKPVGAADRGYPAQAQRQ
ncbi:hypothetical protein G6F40_016432 [Rhizopus arrhizus]|nr:hypothetical protein G6F40_016432 [Rhizopus arrhizus]